MPLCYIRSMYLSIIIPCYNEEGNIQQCLRRIPPLDVENEYLVIDDGSKDNTRQKVLEVMKEMPQLRLLAFDRNQGKGKAVRAGIQMARGEWILILDADMTVPPEEIPQFLRQIKEEKSLIIGTRFVYPFDKRAMRWINRLSNRTTAFLFSVFLKTKITDTLCGTKAFRKEDALKMSLGRDRWGDFDLLLGAACLGLKIVEVPVHYQPRMAGVSSMKAFPDGYLLFKSCLRTGRLARYYRKTKTYPQRDAVNFKITEELPKELFIGEELLEQVSQG